MLAVAAAVHLATATPRITAAPASISIQLAPSTESRRSYRVSVVRVTLRLSGITARRNKPLLTLPLIASNVDTVATVLEHIEARDRVGIVPMTTRDVAQPETASRDASVSGPAREWIAARKTIGPIKVSYFVPARAVLPPRGAAPPFAFSDDGHAFSAAGQVFLLLPPGEARYRLRLSWNLEGLPRGARGVSSFGERDTSPPSLVSAGELRSTFYMAGRIHTWPVVIPHQGFFGVWQGDPPFDAERLMRWTGLLYERYARFFRQGSTPSYGVFLRYNPINAGGGVGLHNSFVTTFGKRGGEGSNEEAVRITLAHEMFHTFQPFIVQPPGLLSSWFGEGLATLYQRRLPLRFGMMTPQQFLNDLNFNAGRYYTSIKASEPNSVVPQRFWADTRIRTLPYDRGMLYFAAVDDELRKKTAGRRSVDDLMFAMLAREHEGVKLANADWEELLSNELGASAVADFRAFLGGRVPLPESDAFGPCFRRTTKYLRRYELGFETEVLAEPKRIVRGLVPGSAAAAAGLRNGDEIVQPVPQDALQGRQEMRLSLLVRRGSVTFPMVYLPRGEMVHAYQWEAVPGSSRLDCGV